MSDYTRRTNNTDTDQSRPTRPSTKERVPKAIAESGRRPIGGTRNSLIISYSDFSPQKTILDALSDLSSQGYSLTEGNYSSMLQNSEDLLNSLGFEPVTQEKLNGKDGVSTKFTKDFSLAKTLNVDSSIQNNKIVDPDLSDLTPEPIDSSDKFKSETDAFYDLDDEKPDNIKTIEKKTRDQDNKKLFIISELLTQTSRGSRNKMIKKTPNNAAIRQ